MDAYSLIKVCEFATLSRVLFPPPPQKKSFYQHIKNQVSIQNTRRGSTVKDDNKVINGGVNSDFRQGLALDGRRREGKQMWMQLFALKASSNNTARSQVIEILYPPTVAPLIIPIGHYAQLGNPYAY